MDEIEVVSALRTDPTPAPEAVDRHRAQLQAAIASAGNGHAGAATGSGDAGDEAGDGEVYDLTLGRPVVGAEPRSHRRRWLLAAAAAAAVGVLATGTVLASRDDEADFTSVPQEEAPGNSELACGSELPFPFELAGYTGPVDGPMDPPPAFRVFGGEGPDQLVQHWDGPNGQVELRWPAMSPIAMDEIPATEIDATAVTTDELVVAPSDDAGSEGAEITVHVADVSLPLGADGGWLVVVPTTPVGESISSAGYSGVVTSTRLGEGACGELAVSVSGSDQEVAGAEFAAVMHALDEQIAAVPSDEAVEPTTPPLVAGTSTDPVPAMGQCEDVSVPNQEQTVDDPATYSTAQEALAAFLPLHGTLLQDGYVEHTLPDGTVSYVRTNESAEVVTVIRATPTGSRWQITSWQATGC